MFIHSMKISSEGPMEARMHKIKSPRQQWLESDSNLCSNVFSGWALTNLSNGDFGMGFSLQSLTKDSVNTCLKDQGFFFLHMRQKLSNENFCHNW